VESHEFLLALRGFVKITAVRIPVSDHLHLRVLEEADAAELHALVEANRNHLSEWMPWASRQTFERTAGYIRSARQRHAENQGFETALVVDDRIVGAVGIANVDWIARSANIGYWISAEYQGRGHMSAAVRALIDHAFGEMGLHRVEIRATEGNVRSRAIPERLGFRCEGRLREAEHVRDEYHDLVVYGLLATDR
jgi:ribosomal-protein-serine acetyltransferase